MVTRAEIMKVTPFLMMILFVCECEILHSQTNYYPNSSGTIPMSGYTYKYDSKYSETRLYNIVNKFMDVDWAFIDGSEMNKDVYFGNIPTIDHKAGPPTKLLAYSIVNNAFSANQKALIKGNKLLINLNIDPSTGYVIDVYFSFLEDSPYRNIPIEVYRTIEVALKEKMRFTMTEIGKKLNYGIHSWEQEPQ